VPPTAASLWLIDGFDLRGGGASLHVALPAQRLLAFLALQRKSASRKAIAAALWTDLDERQGAARLRSTLWRLPTAGGLRLVEVDGQRLRLAEHVEVDVLMAQDDRRVYELDISQLSGELLTDWSEDWVDAERERFRQLRLRRLDQLSEHALRRREFGVALQAALAAVALGPLRESAHRRVMLVHLAEDNPSEALRQYDEVRQLLRDELGLAPSATTRAVVANLLGRPLDAVA
jgi:DNA-binding SARP family transcriptional activator